jgi:hypothetical protein
LIATQYGLWVLRGDPAAGGSLINVSRDVGVVDSLAWAKAGDTVFFLALDGLYRVSADGSDLKDLSGDKLPTELEEIDTSTVDVLLGYSHDDSGIYIFLEGSDYHWFYDLEAGGFWPFTLPEAVAAVFTVDGSMVIEDDNGDHWTLDGDDDNGTDIESHLLIGPIRAGGGSDLGLLAAMHGAVETDGTVIWSIVVGDTAEEVAEDAKAAVEHYLAGDLDDAQEHVFVTGIWSSGRSQVVHPRARAMWYVIWLRSDDPWAYESIVAEMQRYGRWR